MLIDQATLKEDNEMKWELVVVWAYPEETSVWAYDSEDDALQAQRGMMMANGNQISWSCVRPQY